MTADPFASLFPTEDAIPDTYRLSSPLEQRQYLCDGEIKLWQGQQQDVVSPLGVKIGSSIQIWYDKVFN